MIKVAAIQRSSAGSKDHNIKESTRMAEEAALRYHGLDVLVFPEYNNYMEPDPQKALAEAETIEGAYITALRETARALETNIITGSFAEQAKNGKIYNTTLVLNRNGEIIGRYAKIHLSDAMGFQESALVQAGDTLGLVELDCAKIGLFVCYDMRFPELPRSCVLEGAEILFVPSLWPCGNPLPPRTDHWDVLTRATAIHNLTYVVACNQYGAVGGEMPFGRSCIVDPWGTVIAQAGSGTGIVYGELDLAYQEAIRSTVATWQNRRPEVYRL